MKRKFITVLMALLLTTSITACSNKNTASDSNTNQQTTESNGVLTSINVSSGDNESVGNPDTYIELGDNTTVNGNGVTVENNKITITSAGTYSIKGNLTDGQIIVNAGDNDKVYLILNGVNITSSNNSPIYVKNSKKTIISLADNTENSITDGSSYSLDEGEDEPNSAIFSKSDLIFIGTGSLKVQGNYENGITSKDDLKIQSGNITVNAVKNGIKGKDSVVITDGNININSGQDGIKSTNTEKSDKGYVLVEGGTINITSTEDGIQAETNAFFKNGDITINSGGGSENSTKKHEEGAPGGPGMQGNSSSSSSETEESISTKAIKASQNIITEGGTFNINSADDALHSNNNLVINDGTFNLATGDDGIHSDTTLSINGGTINISKSYEGIESETINLNNGNITVNSSDDGINASDGSSSEETNTKGQGGPGGGGRPGESSSNAIININGGKIYVNADGDGIDSNGSINMKDGLVIVNGPTNDGNGPLDFDGNFEISGGTIIATGSSGMAQAPSTDSSQNSIKITLKSQEANTLVHIEDESGNDIATFAPAKQFSSVVISSPNIKTGSTYTVYVGGSSTGTSENGLYLGENYTKGEEVGSATISDSVTEITQEGASVSRGGPGGGGQGGPAPGQDGGRKELSGQGPNGDQNAMPPQ